MSELQVSGQIYYLFKLDVIGKAVIYSLNNIYKTSSPNLLSLIARWCPQSGQAGVVSLQSAANCSNPAGADQSTLLVVWDVCNLLSPISNLHLSACCVMFCLVIDDRYFTRLYCSNNLYHIIRITFSMLTNYPIFSVLSVCV